MYNRDISNTLYKSIGSVLLKIMISLLIVVAFTLIKNPPSKEKPGWPVDSIRFRVDIHDDGSAYVSETWILDIKEEDTARNARSSLFSNGIMTRDFYGFHNMELMNVRVFENNKELTLFEGDTSLRKENGTLFSVESESNPVSEEDPNNRYFVSWKINDYGKNTYELRYIIKNFVGRIPGGAGAYFEFFRANTFSPKKLSVSISLNNEDLNEKLIAGKFTGFQGMAGLRRGSFCADSFGRLQKGNFNYDQIEVFMIMPEDCFRNLSDSQQRVFSNYTYSGDIKELSRSFEAGDVFQRPVSRPAGFVIFGCVCLTPFFAAMLILSIILHTVRMHRPRFNTSPITDTEPLQRWACCLGKYALLSTATAVTSFVSCYYYHPDAALTVGSCLTFPSVILTILFLGYRQVYSKAAAGMSR